MELTGNVQGLIDLVGGGSEVEVTQVLTSGEKIAIISVDDVPTDIYAPSPTAPTEVEVSQVVSSGTKIATISVDGEATDIYAPDSGGGGGIVYSTSEVDTGDKWIDGKSIYARVYYFSNPISLSNSWTNTSISTVNIERVIEMECMHADGSHYGCADCDVTRNGHTLLGLRSVMGTDISYIILKYTHRT